MVLLTSSAVSVAISGGVVCLFTFLLFLSGYVLQQQTVRALQDAFRQPPERKPVPTLPPQFQHLDNDTIHVALEEQPDGTGSVVSGTRGSDEAGDNLKSIRVPAVVEDASQAPLGGFAPDQSLDKDTLPKHFAYIFALLNPSDLCATLLFAKEQRSSSRLETEPSIILLYPSTWESDSSPLHTLALSFMRDVQDLYDLIYHPVQVRNGWDLRAQLLGELQWKRWDYDQALYLRTPGLILDSKVLDSALESTNPRGSWAPLNPSSGDNPDVLLVTPKGLQSPRKEMRKLAMPAGADHTQTEGDDVNTEDAARNAAYVLFGEEDLGHVTSNNQWYRDHLRRFDEGRRSVCVGSGLLNNVPKLI
ncbi:hypothetical protein A1O3_00856 [Capronia epimyces CBS 606.96]|uniref:Uncharacterized protein n=1 Tax=Capronia epimyces CBS 606.96 TaxID=1182542 RepID=W9YSR5_9EURO|nr:uncharacterized protein A1O3_00856 [Capronia epimyces CBS 606.96]EXJ92306.1 hypothetical protein A1O3_00856 [Capronia epimyces CBS 606.96]